MPGQLLALQPKESHRTEDWSRLPSCRRRLEAPMVCAVVPNT